MDDGFLDRRSRRARPLSAEGSRRSVCLCVCVHVCAHVCKCVCVCVHVQATCPHEPGRSLVSGSPVPEDIWPSSVCLCLGRP